MSIDEWLEKFSNLQGQLFTAVYGAGSQGARWAREVSLSPPPVGAYTARAGDWWVYG